MHVVSVLGIERQTTTAARNSGMAMFVKPRSREAVALQTARLYEHRHCLLLAAPSQFVG
jgi:hypothetical protein